jgi:hypothetical protein
MIFCGPHGLAPHLIKVGTSVRPIITEEHLFCSKFPYNILCFISQQDFNGFVLQIYLFFIVLKDAKPEPVPREAFKTY